MKFHDALIINLDSRPDRWDIINDLCLQCGLYSRRISAVQASPGWVGCGFSQVKCIEIAKEEQLPWVLILEDDAQFSKDTLDRFRNALPYLWAHRDKWERFNGGPTFAPDFNPSCLDVHHQMLYANGYCTHFHLIQESAYDKVLGWKPEFGPIDVYFNRLSCEKAGFRGVCTYPHIATQRVSKSDVELSNDVQNYDNYFRYSGMIIRQCLDSAPMLTSEVDSFKALHPYWCGTLSLSKKGSFIKHDEFKSTGTYFWSSANRLVVNWYDHGQEVFLNMEGLLVEMRIASRWMADAQ